MSDSLGEVLDDDGRVGLRYERRLAQPPEAVWQALTESGKLRHWMPCDLVGERRAGASLVLPFWPDHVERYGIPEDQLSLAGEVRVWEPPRIFEWTWDADILRWELTAQGDGTLLVFTTWFGRSHEQAYPAAQVAAGYHACLAQLRELLDTGAVRVPLVDVPVGELEATYSDVITPR